MTIVTSIATRRGKDSRSCLLARSSLAPISASMASTLPESMVQRAHPKVRRAGKCPARDSGRRGNLRSHFCRWNDLCLARQGEQRYPGQSRAVAHRAPRSTRGDAEGGGLGGHSLCLALAYLRWREILVKPSRANEIVSFTLPG